MPRYYSRASVEPGEIRERYGGRGGRQRVRFRVRPKAPQFDLSQNGFFAKQAAVQLAAGEHTCDTHSHHLFSPCPVASQPAPIEELKVRKETLDFECRMEQHNRLKRAEDDRRPRSYHVRHEYHGHRGDHSRRRRERSHRRDRSRRRGTPWPRDAYHRRDHAAEVPVVTEHDAQPGDVTPRADSPTPVIHDDTAMALPQSPTPSIISIDAPAAFSEVPASTALEGDILQLIEDASVLNLESVVNSCDGFEDMALMMDIGLGMMLLLSLGYLIAVLTTPITIVVLVTDGGSA
ncbi:hypothetical protein BU15DRAFT_63276 [Melanogaster broomeanus]|nr:hypothetical protein BU15DRAFT_63276 [Melanogaster broomeanus]